MNGGHRGANLTTASSQSVLRTGDCYSSIAPSLDGTSPVALCSPLMDHDQRLKTLIRAFFADFLRLFFADWAGRLDLSAVEWLDQELYPDPPEGTRHVLDMVARAPILAAEDSGPPASILLVHIEIESADHTTRLTPRLPYYYHFLRDKHQLPVLPIVIYLKVGLDGVGVDDFVEELFGLEVNRFQYLYVALPGLDGVEYLQGDNWLGVALAALMRIPPEQVAWLGAEALRRLAGAPLGEQARFLLGECVQAYLPLDEQRRQEYESLLQTKSYAEVLKMNQTVYEKGMEEGRLEGRSEGRLEGRLEGQIDLTCALIEDRFGSVPDTLRQELERLSVDELLALAPKIPKAKSLEELGLSGSR